MKKLTTILIALMMLTGCEEEVKQPAQYEVVQKIVNFNSGESKYCTIVYENKFPFSEAMKLQCDDIESVTDSLKNARKEWAQQFINKCKSLEK